MTDETTSTTVTTTPDMLGWRLDRALAALIPALSRERLKSLISSGHVDQNGAAIRDPATKLKACADYSVRIPPPTPAHNIAQDIALEIVYEDDHLLIVDKPAGLVVHPAAGNFDGTLVNALLHHCAGRLSGIGGVARPGIVHRIDKDTSGLMVVAKTDRAHIGLAAQFSDHSIERRYTAIVSGIPLRSGGTIDAPLARAPTNRMKVAICAVGHGKRAVTHYRLIETLNDAALVECRLETGRTHQVRVHMASINHALLGDPVYSRTRASHAAILKELNFTRQALHAALIGFIHPVDRKNMAFESKMPLDMQRLFTKLRV